MAIGEQERSALRHESWMVQEAWVAALARFHTGRFLSEVWSLIEERLTWPVRTSRCVGRGWPEGYLLPA